MEKPVVIVDNGSGYIKAGFSGEESPRAVFRSICGPYKNPYICIGHFDPHEIFVGDGAMAKRGILIIKEPIPTDPTKEVDYENLATIWKHTLSKELGILDIYDMSDTEHSVLMTSLPRYVYLLFVKSSLLPVFPNLNRMRISDFEKMSEILFETLGVKSLQIADSSVLSMFTHKGSNSGTCTILDSGFGCTKSISVKNYHPIHESLTRMMSKDYKGDHVCVGGEEITTYLVKLLSDRGYEMTTRAEREIVRDIKEKLCYVSLDYESELCRPSTDHSHLHRRLTPEEEEERQRRRKKAYGIENYELPDGSIMEIGSERFRAPEILFKPGFLGCLEDISVSSIIKQSIQKSCEVLGSNKEETFLKNIVLTGGSTMIHGFEDRLRYEVKREFGLLKKKSWVSSARFDDDDSKDGGLVGIHSPSKRKFGGWVGGSIISSLSSFKFVEKEKVKEYGSIHHLFEYAVCDIDHYFTALRSKDKNVLKIEESDSKLRTEFVLEQDNNMSREERVFTIILKNKKVKIRFVRILF